MESRTIGGVGECNFVSVPPKVIPELVDIQRVRQFAFQVLFLNSFFFQYFRRDPRKLSMSMMKC